MPAESTSMPLPNSTVRGFCTLAVLLHFTFVAIAYSGNNARSQLQSRLLDVFRPYTGLLGIDLNFAPYHLTRANEADVDHVIEYLPADAESEEDDQWRRVHPRSFGGFAWKHRQQSWARVWSFYRGQDEVTARLARAAGEYLVQQRDVRPKQIRCRKHYLQPWDLVADGDAQERDPDSELYFQTVYSCNVIVDDSGAVDIIKISAAGEVAPPRKTKSNQPAESTDDDGGAQP